jgi:hypothetical protein
MKTNARSKSVAIGIAGLVLLGVARTAGPYTYDVGAAISVTATANGVAMSANSPGPTVSICAGGTVNFSASASDSDHRCDCQPVADGIAYYYWQFGDGGYSWSQNPSHTYTGSPPTPPGYWQVTLAVDDSAAYADDSAAYRYCKIALLENTPPAINIVKPAVEGEYVGGTTFIKAYISDASGIAWANFYVDAIFLGYMWQEADYWRYNWNTSGVTMGTHTIKVEAADNSACHNVGSATRGVYAHPSVSLSAISFVNGHALWKRDTDQEITPPAVAAGLDQPLRLHDKLANDRRRAHDVQQCRGDRPRPVCGVGHLERRRDLFRR